MNYRLYLTGLLGFGVLFALSRGTFGASARYLRKKIPYLETIADEKLLKRALLLLFTFHILGLLCAISEAAGSGAEKKYLARSEYGQGESTQIMTMQSGDSKETVKITIPERNLSEKEMDANLKKAKKLLPSVVLGSMTANHIDGDLNLEEELPDLNVSVTYMTSSPETIDWNGVLGEGIPASGVPVTITASLTCGEKTVSEELALTAYPRKLSHSESLQKEVNDWIAAHNDATEEKVRLPSKLRGKRVTWSDKAKRKGPWILALGWLASILLLGSRQEKKKKEKEKQKQLLLIDYPHIVSRFSLLLGAGLSERKALAQIAKRYLRKKKEGGETRPGFELLIRAREAMNRGESELSAYQGIGRSAELMEYRNFSNLLVQNLTRGGREMLLLMEKEADRSLSDRQARASVLGEEAGTKLLLPMMLLLGIVMAILMVPAVLSFG